jgi:branched-chain amino acid transport system permease protein
MHALGLAYFLQLLVNGLATGMIYALIAIGLSLIFGVIEIVNFAHGEFYMLGAMLSYFLVTAFPGFVPPYLLTVLFVTLAISALGYLFYEGLLRRLRGKSFERSILLTLGVSMVLQNGAIFLWSSTPRFVPSPYTYTNVSALGVRIGLLKLFALGLAVAAFAMLHLVLNHTRVGKAMRGIAQNREAAIMVGIDPEATARLAVIVGIGLAGLAGAALAPIYSVQPTVGFAYMFKAFAVIIIGGLGNLGGAALAAILLGVLESFASGFFPLIMVDVLSFSLMILVLLVRPRGLFGQGIRV